MTGKQAQAQDYTLVVGLGATGLSVVRHLSALGEPLVVADSRDIPPNLQTLKQDYPQVAVHTGGFDQPLFTAARRIVVSPGVPMTDAALMAARDRGVEIVGDLDLFAHENRAPVVGITGSNGKSTVTALLSHMLQQAGRRVATGGNIGTPALDLLQHDAEVVVLELSSFQLDSLHRLPMQTAVVLNISADHMDRYADMGAYIASKLSIYRQAEQAVVNLDDTVLAAQSLPADRVLAFTLASSADNVFGVDAVHGEPHLAFAGEPLLPVSALKIKGAHNVANALAALALGWQMQLPVPAMLAALQGFTGLPHRSQWVAEINGVNWYNDSKATNVGAAVAAIEGLPGRHVLIAGGDAKAADFSALAEVVKQRVRAVVLIGQDAPRLADALHTSTRRVFASDMGDAVRQAQKLAQAGDNVLLSPACASFDMFDNFARRGEAFVQAVRELQA